jgi:predicted O-methyltransferase YrrM
MRMAVTVLCDLAFQYGTDKCPQIKHHYTEVYYEMFKDRQEDVKKVVEIGVGTGASLYMWRDFFPNAMIYGADILPELLFEDERIKTFHCDQRVHGDLMNLIEKTGAGIDLFIDDGSHRPEDQVLTCLNMMPLLQENAIYVIEDAGRAGIIHDLSQFDCHKIGFADRVYRDDRLIVVRKKHG